MQQNISVSVGYGNGKVVLEAAADPGSASQRSAMTEVTEITADCVRSQSGVTSRNATQQDQPPSISGRNHNHGSARRTKLGMQRFDTEAPRQIGSEQPGEVAWANPDRALAESD